MLSSQYRWVKNASLHYGGVLRHKGWVCAYAIEFCLSLIWRALIHDLSKFLGDEARSFIDVVDQLATTEYGSERYKELMQQIRPCLDRHYYRNSHHPEHHRRELEGMTLLDIVEMFLDWKAAVRRHDTGDIMVSIRRNKSRFRMGKLAEILSNEARRVWF